MFTINIADAVPPGVALIARIAMPVLPSFPADWTVTVQVARGASGAVHVVALIRK
jgi:hypothetical protein